MIAWNDVHRHSKIAHWFQERLAVMVQRLEVDELPMIVIVPEMQDLLDPMLLAVREEHFAIKLGEVVQENVGGITNSAVCVVENRNQHIMSS